MSTYTAELVWERGTQEFLTNQYSRRHLIRFDGGAELLGSSSPSVVPPPGSDPAGVDPEEAFVSSLSSCHMLWFLAIAAKRGFVVDRYEDNPIGEMARNAERRVAMSVATQDSVRRPFAMNGKDDAVTHKKRSGQRRQWLSEVRSRLIARVRDVRLGHRGRRVSRSPLDVLRSIPPNGHVSQASVSQVVKLQSSTHRIGLLHVKRFASALRRQEVLSEVRCAPIASTYIE
jgi:organic hydroperoxide reductase OsmC/OhrA